MRAAIYARVSSAAQRDKQTIESQLRVLPEYVKRQGWTLAGKYIDDGLTAKAGHLDARVGLAALLRDAAAGKFEIVVVIDVDRLTRSEDLVERYAVLGAFQRAGIRIACAGSGSIHDLNSSEGDLQVVIGSYFAAEWGRKHRKRVVEGKLTAIARGKKPAGPTPYGYRYERAAGVWSINEPEAEIVREIFDRVLAGESGRAVGDDLEARNVPRPKGGEWSRERVYAVLRQPAYRGEWMADKRRKLTVKTPVIVDAATWYAARDRSAAAARHGLRRTKHIYLLEGIAVCSVCGGRMGIASASNGNARGVRFQARYVCQNRRRPARGEAPCHSAYHQVSDVDARVWDSIYRLVVQPQRLERAARQVQQETSVEGEAWRADLAKAERRIEQLQRAETAILARFRRGSVTEAAMDIELDASGRERAMAQEQLEAARRAGFAAGRVQDRAKTLESSIDELRAAARNASPAKRRELVERLLRPGSVTIGANVELVVHLTPPSRSFAGPRDATGYRSDDETSVEIRLVA